MTHPLAPARAAGLLLAMVLMLPACGDSDPETGSQPPGTQEADEEVAEELWALDLPGIHKRGELRILHQRRKQGYLPRAGSPLDSELEQAAALARDLALEPRFVALDSFDALLPALLAGSGDLVVENLTATAERRKQVTFSIPIAFVHEQLVTRDDDESPTRLADLPGRRIAVQRSASFWETAEKLHEAYPDLEIEEVSEDLDMEDLLDGVESGRFDLTLADSNLMDAAVAWHPKLRVAVDLGENRIIAWAMRPDTPELRKAVDTFLAASAYGARSGGAARSRESHTEDLPGIQKRRLLRVLTRNSGATYFIYKGELVGFEYELARKFATDRGLRLELVVPPSRRDLLPWLVQGKGDVVAASLSASPERAAREGVAFSRHYNIVREMVVTRAEDVGLAGVDDLDGRRLVVRRSSSYWSTLEKLRHELAQRGLAFELVAAPEESETEEILARVASGEYDLTLADSHIVDIELVYRDDLRAAFAVGGDIHHGWAVRANNPELLAEINGFFDAEYRGLFYNMRHKKYFQSPRGIRTRAELRTKTTGQISRYDALVRKHAERFNLDWRLALAQMYQESRFDPTARSFVGARGLLQVMPRTAREMGYHNLEDPEIGVKAGLQYLDWVRDRFESTLSPADRTWLALAAYNVGFGHVNDARRIATQRGWNGDRWFGNVERAMLLKEKPEVHRTTRFGYARGSEPVNYVRDIRDRYRAYLRLDTDAASR
jgi:membrane-bound lytic murein transglycosylase F